jgi:hypothetical protein
MRSKHLLPLPFLVAIVLSLVLATSALSAPPRNHHGHHWANRSPIAYTYFLPQMMGNHHRMPLFFSWGTLRYNKWGEQFEFAFNGFNLARNQEYTLVYYPGEEAAMICLGQGRSNRMGYLHLSGSADICSLPVAEDTNYPNGARIMLVPSEDTGCEEGVLFVPRSSQNLLSRELVRFTDTDGCPVLEPPVTPPTPTPTPTPTPAPTPTPTPTPPAEEEGEASDEGGQTTEPEGESDQDEQGEESTEPEDESGQDDPPYGGMPY